MKTTRQTPESISRVVLVSKHYLITNKKSDRYIVLYRPLFYDLFAERKKLLTQTLLWT
jgi:hypothetical protein